ncbi:hypothetical protein LLH23_18095 [bacterium]|nr:hypothetical protein [bacterium]
MNWVQYLGRALLAVGVIAIAAWATANKLIDMPVHVFWTGILSYLVAAEVGWTLAERHANSRQQALPRRGLLKLTRQDRPSPVLPRWFAQGGRVRLSDVVARHDSQREALAAVQTVVMARVSGPRLHLLAGAPGSGRSTFLYRLGRALVEASQEVFLVLPTPELLALEQVLQAAKRGQTYLLVDDLDLRPEAEEWLYELQRFGLPVVVVATIAPAAEAAREGLAAAQPVSLVSQATVHDISVAHGDVVALSRKLGTEGDLQRVGLSLEEVDSLLTASRALRGSDGHRGLWHDLDQGEGLPAEGKLMVALAGCAEMGFPEPLWLKLFGAGSLSRWQKASLVASDNSLVLPPHRLACLEHLTDAGADSPAVAAALATLCRESVATEPAFAARLLGALARLPETRDLARAQMEQVRAAGAAAEAPAAVQRLWHRALDALDMLPADAALSDYPPEINLLVHSAFAHQAYARMLELAGGLGSNPVYGSAAHYDTALALAHLGELGRAEGELDAVQGGVVGAQYLRGVLAEMQGDVVRALDAYEASRKADELQLASTRALAFAYVKAGAPRSAIPLFEALLAYHPREAELYAGLAVAHLLAGTAQRAAAQSARAIQAGVDPIEARKAVARACAGVHAYSRVAPELEACVSYDETDMEVWEGLAVACRWLGRFAREEECLRRLQRHDPQNEEHRLEMARCQRDLGRGSEAYELLQPLLAGESPDLRALLLAVEVAAAGRDQDTQRALALRALQLGDDSGWSQFWLGDSRPELDEEARAAYRTAIRQLQHQVQEGATPRQTATVWQAIYLAAARLQDTDLADQALRKATQEAAICEALGAEIHSIAHRRAVPPDVFLDSLPPHDVPPSAPPAVEPQAPDKPNVKPVTAPTESSTIRNRRLRGNS